MADNTPAAQTDAVSAPEKATTQEEIVPKFAKGLEESKEEATQPEAQPEVAPVTQPETEDEQAVLKKRLNGAISEVEKRNEESRRYLDLQVEQVSENNELIHKVAAVDPILANKVVQKIWGNTGIRSYKQLVERSKLEALKETNPDAYETKRELFEIKSRLESSRAKEQERVKNDFFEKNGIKENEYDPKYKKLMHALDNLNPSLVSEDYGKALELAKTIAFGESRREEVVEVPTISVGGGKKPAPLPAAAPQVSDQSSWLAENLNKKFGYKIQL